MHFLGSSSSFAVVRSLADADFLGDPLLWVRLIAVLGLMGASAIFWQATRGRRGSLEFSGEGKIVVADTCSLGNRQFLVVAQYGSEKHLIGVSTTSISYLSSCLRKLAIFNTSWIRSNPKVKMKKLFKKYCLAGLCCFCFWAWLAFLCLIPWSTPKLRARVLPVSA